MFRTTFLFFAPASLLLLLCSSAVSQSGPPRRVSTPPVIGPAEWKPAHREISTAYWTLEPGWNTQIEMRNNLVHHELTVTPVLRLATGQEKPLAPVTIAPQHVISVDLRSPGQVDPAILDRIGSFGSVVFRFDGLDSANLFGATIVHREGRPIDFHFDADDSGPSYSSGGIEGIWWLPTQSSTDYLILSNPFPKAVTGFLALSGLSRTNRPLPITIGSNQTKRIDLREVLAPSAEGGMGGLSLSLPGKESLSATQIVFDEVTGLTAIMKLFDRETDDEAKSHTLLAPMMALSQPDPGLGFPDGTTLIPRVFLRSAGSAPTEVSVELNWRGESKPGTFAVPKFSLSAGDVKIVTLADSQWSGQIPRDANWGTLKISYTGRSADLVAVALSYDKEYRYGLQTPFSETLARLWAGGMWHVDATHNTLITTGNGGSEPTTAEVTLFYNNGKGRYRMKKLLAPGQPLWLDVGQLVHNQVPDIDGHTLPADAMSGSYELRDLDHATVGQLYEGKLVIDKTYGHASYGCGECCGYYNVTLNPNPFGGPPGIDNNDVVNATEQCSGFVDDMTSAAYNWGSSNTAVATLPNRTLHTVAVGSATGSTEIYLLGTNPAPRCPSYYYNPPQPVTVECPSSNSLSSVYALSITLLFPSLKTGIGAMATIQLSPTTTNWNGYQIGESLITSSNSCPSSWGNLCQGSSLFTVGAAAQASVPVNGVETGVGPVFAAEENVFYDQHTITSSASLLDSAGINSCTAVCTQTYSCSGTPIGSRTITYSFIKAQINGTHVTSTEVSEQ